MSYSPRSRSDKSSSDSSSHTRDLVSVHRTYSLNHEPFSIFPEASQRPVPQSSDNTKEKGKKRGNSSNTHQGWSHRDQAKASKHAIRRSSTKEARDFVVHQMKSLRRDDPKDLAKKETEKPKGKKRLISYEDSRHMPRLTSKKNKNHEKSGKKRYESRLSIPDWLENSFVTSMQLKSCLKVNRLRQNYELEPLELVSLLNEVAGCHNYDQAYILKTGSCSHKGSDDSMLGDRLASVEYKYTFAYENLARGCESLPEVLEVFTSNRKGRSHLLSPFVTHMGMHAGKDINGITFWTFVLCG